MPPKPAFVAEPMPAGAKLPGKEPLRVVGGHVAEERHLIADLQVEVQVEVAVEDADVRPFAAQGALEDGGEVRVERDALEAIAALRALPALRLGKVGRDILLQLGGLEPLVLLPEPFEFARVVRTSRGRKTKGHAGNESCESKASHE
jgi:hypothetical protein